MKNEVVLTGYYGQKNFGDDIFCQVATWGVNNFWRKKVRFYVTGLPGFPATFQYYQPKKFFIKGQALLYQYITSLLSDLIIYSGGSIFHSKPKPFYSINLFNYFLSNFGKKIGAIGISTGPFKSEEDYIWVRNYLSRFSYITSRDQNTFRTLKEMNLPGKVSNAFDLAVLYPKLFPLKQNFKIDGSKKIIGVSVCHYERFTGKNLEVEKKREENLLSVLKILLLNRDDIQLKFFVINGNERVGDEEITNYFVNQLKNLCDSIEIIKYKNDPELIVNEILKCDLIIGVRLHSCIMAYVSKVPFLLVEYHPKCTYFLDDINFPKEIRIGDKIFNITDTYRIISEVLDQDREKFFSQLLLLEDAQKQALLSFIDAPWVKDE